ncbi:hypothetical protein [Roseovarius sp. Pro17]|uniref:hypothetical protein n=1 Tax=Roseovarius sp. Pro17 TaxID=3108175 RepID=UPI002D771EF4|nr:hypothetical protein [Roseovarius sp. Pro17]
MSKVKWVVGALAVVGASTYGYFEYMRYSVGYYDLPEDVPETASVHSFKGGLRGIYLNSPNEIRTREHKMVGISSDLPEWYNGAWSHCSKPEDDFDIERLGVKHEPGMRFEALCYIEVEGERPVYSGALFSVPNL